MSGRQDLESAPRALASLLSPLTAYGAGAGSPGRQRSNTRLVAAGGLRSQVRATQGCWRARRRTPKLGLQGKPSPSPLYPQTSLKLYHTSSQDPGAKDFRAQGSQKQGNHTHSHYIFFSSL